MATSAVARAPHHHGKRNGNGAPRQRSADGQVFGVLLMVFGLGWFLRVSGAVAMDWETLVSVVLIVLGFGMALTARARTGGLLMVLGILLTISLATTSSVGEVGELAAYRTFTPESVAELRDDYRFWAGARRIDLTRVAFPKGQTAFDVSMTGGEVVVVVPDGLAVHVEARLAGGEIRILHRPTVEGGSISDTYADPDYEEAETKLRLDVSGLGGKIEVSRAPAKAPTDQDAPSDGSGDGDASG